MKSMKTSAPVRRAGAAALGVAAVLALAACAPPGAAQPSEAPTEGETATGTLKVGYISPITGNFAIAGQEMVDGWNLYWEVNGNEVNGVTVETIVEDDAGNPETSLTKAKKLVESDGVDVVIGPLLANTALAVAAYTSSVGIPSLQPVAAADDLTQRQANDLTVRTGSQSGSQTNFPGGQWAAGEGHKTAVTLCPDYAFGWESCAGFKQGFESEGGEVVAQYWFPNGTSDFSTYVSQIQAAGADIAFVATAGGAPGPDFLRSFLGLGLGGSQELLMNCCGMDQATLRALGPEIEGFKSVSYWAEGRDSDAVREFSEAYGEAYEGKLPSANVAGGYMTASLVAAVLDENGLVTGEELVSAITEYTFEDSIFGRVSWDEFNNTVGPVYIREVQEVDGKWVNVPIETFEDVDQWLGKDPEEAMQQPTYSQSFQG
ncbi:ABC transporter substrate-binding protein [Microbacterium immunditiarum]|uniref:Branched-chain amino acid transport system substrate-binding protein n=1 Tax=Microbacterium immunditiarum TaxID=337480 RepID=A0A7Y9GN47_9MICO|nr:ABC transporter substrate-binding protein [Microbacterium immunditiarum]NYE19546.1 branched-chain amino acid transport system substrate-binding protein [Microbacterium immunditiarum]